MQVDFAVRARAAFAAGWAGTGGPLTPRVAAACRAAVALAAEHPNHPGVLEATLLIGSMEGTWARVYARREALYTTHIDAITTAWRAWITTHLDVPAVVGAYRRKVGAPVEAASDAEQRRREREVAAIALLLLLLHGMLADGHRDADPTYVALIGTIEVALREGTAEGTAGAVALLAQQAGHTAAVDFDKAYTDALAAAAGEDQYAALALAWLKRMVASVAAAAGRALAAADEPPDATTDDEAEAVTDTTSGEKNHAVPGFADWLLGAAFWLGGLAVYAALNIAAVNWVTVGDTRVCAACAANEDNSPYPLISAPSPPQHPRCRCWTVPAGPVASLGQFATYLIGG